MASEAVNVLDLPVPPVFRAQGIRERNLIRVIQPIEGAALAAVAAAQGAASTATGAAGTATAAAGVATQQASNAAGSAASAAGSAGAAAGSASAAAGSASAASGSASAAAGSAGTAQGAASTATTQAGTATAAAGTATNQAGIATTAATNLADAVVAVNGFKAAYDPDYARLDAADRPIAISAPGPDGAHRELGFVDGAGALHWTAGFFEALASAGPFSAPMITTGTAQVYGYETLEVGDIFVLDVGGRIVSTYSGGAASGGSGGAADLFSEYDTLETGSDRVLITDKNGRLRGVVPSIDLDPLAPEVSAARGNAPSLSARLANVLDLDGSLRTPHWGLWRLRQTRMKLRSILAVKAGQTNVLSPTTQFCVSCLGDSYTYNSSHVEPLTRSLRNLLGDAGGGWINLRSPYNRPHSVVGEYITTLSGSWTETVSANPTPDLGIITSTTAGDKVTVSAVASAVPVSAIALHYVPSSDGQVQYRWNGGAWTALALTSGTGSANVALTGFPASGAWTLEVAVVSGTCRLAGFDVRGAALGVRVNKLGQNGSSALQWSSQAALDAWLAAHTSLGTDLFIIQLSANDQPSRTPGQIAANLLTIATRARLAMPAADVLISQQPENQLGRATPMASITAAVRAMCVANGIAFLDQQYVFGDTVADYSTSSPHNWQPDLMHPDALLGGPAMADALYRSIVHSI